MTTPDLANARKKIVFFLNGERQEVSGHQAFLTLSDYLRYEVRKTGTKVVCAEGDCGACTVLVGELAADASSGEKKIRYTALNSCIVFVNAMDAKHVITIEGVAKRADAAQRVSGHQALHPLQSAFARGFASQCGFCTPGIVMALLQLFEDKAEFNEKNVKNYLTGNLCRCTGYQSIIDSALTLSGKTVLRMNEVYDMSRELPELEQLSREAVFIETPEKTFFAPTSAADAVAFKSIHSGRAAQTIAAGGSNQANPGGSTSSGCRIFSGATDLGVFYNKGQLQIEKVLSLQKISEWKQIHLENGVWSIGANATFSQIYYTVGEKDQELARYLNIFASPQIKNGATLAGNIANASSIADSPPYLMVSDAEIELLGTHGARRVPISKFYLGYRKTAMRPDEFISRIFIPQRPDEADGLSKGEWFKLYKASKRKDLDISTVNAGFYLSWDRASSKCEKARVSYGGVGPIVVRLYGVEQMLIGKGKAQVLDADFINQVCAEIAGKIKPLSDVRGSQTLRTQLAQNLYRKFLFEAGGGPTGGQ